VEDPQDQLQLRADQKDRSQIYPSDVMMRDGVDLKTYMFVHVLASVAGSQSQLTDYARDTDVARRAMAITEAGLRELVS